MGKRKSMVMGILAVIISAFGSIAMAEDFRATTIGNYDNVTVMEVTGNYDAPVLNDPANAIPREIIAKEFYRTHADDYDFLVIFSNFDFQMPISDINGKQVIAGGFYQPVRNDTAGIGKSVFDNSASFGSNRKLQGTIDMGYTGKKVLDPLDPGFEQTMTILSHELLHRWAAFIKFKKWDGTLSNDLLGLDNAHWSFLLDSQGSMQYGNRWQANGDGTFSSLPGSTYYSPLDLYLMGVMNKTEVPPMLLIENPEMNKDQLPKAGITIAGTPHYVSVDDIIGAEGERIPDVVHSQKNFKIGCIYITRPGTFEGQEQVYQLKNAVKNWVIWFSSLTKGKAIARVDVNPGETIPVNPGVTPPPYDPRTAPPSINDALSWLLDNQEEDGSWRDMIKTTDRDTTEAVLTLKYFPDMDAQINTAIQWLNKSPVFNTDYLSRKIETFTRTGNDTVELVQQLVLKQRKDGSWGSENIYNGNVVDTAWAMRALAITDYQDENIIEPSIGYLKDHQKQDGGWSNEDQDSTIQATVNVVYVFIKYQEQYQLADAIQKGLAWLFGRQNPDGGFGDSPSTVYDTALALSLLKHFQVATEMTDKALNYLLASQEQNGSWYSSPSQTAQAMNALMLWKNTVAVDLAVDADKITFTPQAVNNPPEKVIIRTEVGNLGLIGVSQVKVVLYDGAVQEANKKGEQIIDLPAKSSRDLEFEVTIEDDKAHTFIIVMDPDNQVKESNEENNSASQILENHTCMKPDLAVNAAEIVFTPENITTIPQNVEIQVRVSNKGRMDANNCVIALYDGEVSGTRKIGEQTVNIAAGASTLVSFTSTVSDGKGHFIYAVADPDNQLDECIESNNKAGKLLNTKMTYDFQALNIDASPVSVDMLGTITLTARISNRGTSDAFNVPVRYYIDAPNHPYEIATLNTNIPAGQTVEQSVTWKADLAGENMPLIIQADPSNAFDELSEDNNKAVTYVTVKQFTQANLSIGYEDILITPAPALEAGEAVISALVKNEGFAQANNVEVAFYQGTSKDDMALLGSQTVPVLDPGQSVKLSQAWSNIAVSGMRYIMIVVDPQNNVQEIKEDDNTVFTMLNILTLPDLAIAANSIAFSPEAPKEGEEVNIQVSVQNLGDQEAADVAVQVKENGQLFASDNIDKIAGHSQGIINFQYPTQGKPGGHRIDVVVDPENRIREKTKENNTALRSFGVQNADLWLSEPIFSPNGDGIKDSTQFFFRLKQAQTVQVMVVNAKGTIVRTFTGDEFKNTLGNAVTWDGLDEQGRVVLDGQYQFQVRNSAGVVLAMLPVIVDTDRSPLTDAIGTGYLFQQNLTCALPDIDWWQWLPDESGIVFLIRNADVNKTGYSEGIYTVSPDGEDIRRIVPAEWCGNNGTDYSYAYNGIALAPDGARVAFTLEKYNKKTNKTESRELWITDRYGENKFNLLTSSMTQGDSWSFEYPRFSPDGRYVAYKAEMYVPYQGYSYKIGLIKTDGSMPAEAPLGNYIYADDYRWSPDSTRICYTETYPTRFFCLDTAGHFSEICSIADTGSYPQEMEWLDENQLIAAFFNNSLKGVIWKIDASGKGNHELLAQEENYNELLEVAINQKDQAVAYLDGGYKDDAPDKNKPYQWQAGLCESAGTCRNFYNTSFQKRFGGEGTYIPFWDLAYSADGQKIAFFDQAYEELNECDYNGYVVIIDKDSLKKQAIPVSGHENPCAGGSDQGRSGYGNGYFGSLQWFPDDEQLIAEDSGGIFGILPEQNQKVYFPAKREGIRRLNPNLSPKGRYITYQQGVNQDSICYQKDSPNIWALGSLLNLTADLKVIKNKNSITLRGTAADLHFESYWLEYADIQDPTDWKPLAPPSGHMVVNKNFMEWIPPFQGIFLVRLVVQDQAGNTAWDRKRVSWGQFSFITDLKQSDVTLSPNGDGVKDTVELSYQITAPVNLQFFIYDENNHLVRTIRKVYEEAMPGSMVWDGRDEANQVVLDGVYTIKVMDYSIPVEVDKTFPSAGMILKQVIELSDKSTEGCLVCGQPCCTELCSTPDDPNKICKIENGQIHSIKAVLNAYASDKNIKEWFLEYGEGENPQEWYEIGRGTTESGVYDLSLDFWLGKRFRLTAIDWAGNRVTDNTYQEFDWTQTLFITNWDTAQVKYYKNKKGDQFRFCDRQWKAVDFLKREIHRIRGIQSVLLPISRLMLQYHRNDQWIDALEKKDIVSNDLDFIWDASVVPIQELEEVDQVRLRALDTANNEYFSLPILLIPKSRFSIEVESDCAGKITKLKTDISIFEELKLLKFQVKGENDPKYKEWTDFLVLNIIDSNEIPGSIDLPNGLLDTTYAFRMIGTGIKGTKFISNELNSGSVSNAKNLCASFVIDPKATCDSISKKALMTIQIPSSRIVALYLKSKSFDMQSVSYWLHTGDKTELISQKDLRSVQWQDLVREALEKYKCNTEIELIPAKYEYDTQHLTEGEYWVSMQLDYIEKNQEGNFPSQFESGVTVYVDRTLPESRLFGYAEQPLKNLVLCPRQIITKCGDQNVEWYSVDVEGLARDTGSWVRYYALYYSSPDAPDKWKPAKNERERGRCSSPDRCNPLSSLDQISGTTAVSGILGTWDVSDLLGKKDINLKLEVEDKAGNVKCVVVTCDINPPPGFIILADKQLFSPNHDGLFDTVNINYRFYQESIASLKVTQAGQTIKNLFADQRYPSGNYSIEWDGTDENGQVAKDGQYDIVISIYDLCGKNAITKSVTVEIDNTPPMVEITYPNPQSKPGLIIEVKGSVNDLHFSNYHLTVPEINTEIGAGNAPRLNNILGSWNRYGLNGRYTIKLVAEDTVTNRSEKIVEVQLDAIGDFIKNLEAAPAVFSPNNDNKLETTLIHYELSNTLPEGYLVEIRIISNNTPIRTYAPGEPLLSGRHDWTWDGKDDQGVKVADGTYIVRLTATHPLDPNNNQFEEITVEVDNTPPEINLAQPPEGGFIKDDAIACFGSITDKNIVHYDLTFKSGDRVDSVADGQENRTQYTFGTISAPPDGPGLLFIHAQDAAQNEAQKTIAFTVDRTPPKVVLSSPVAGEIFGNKKTTISIQGSIEEKNLKQWILSYGPGEKPQQWVELVAGDKLPLDNNLYQWHIGTEQGIPDGLYTIRLFASDKAGWEAEARTSVMIDNHPPQVAIQAPADGGYVTKVTNILGTAFDGNLAEYSLEISASDCATAYKWNLLHKDTQNVKDGLIATLSALPPDGRYCLRLKAVDRVGYESETRVSIIVDTTPPAAPVLSGKVKDKANALLSWTANVEPDLAGYNLYRDNQKINQELIKDTQYLDEDLKEGTYNYIVKAVDKAGLESIPSNQVSLKIDLTPPAARIAFPKDGAKINDVVKINGTAYSEEDFKEYRVYVGQGATPTAWQLLVRSPVPIPYGKLADWDTITLSENQYILKLEAEDLSGNTNTHRVSVWIDNTPPGPPNLTKAEQQGPLVPNVDLAWEANPDSDVIGYLLYRNNELANMSGNVIGDLKPYLIKGTTYTDKDLPDGKFTYYVMAMDDAGNISEQSNTRDVNIDIHAPKVLITVPKNGECFENTVLVKGETRDLDIKQVQFQYQKAGATDWIDLNAPVLNPPYITYLDPKVLNLDYGTYRLQAIGTDLGGRTDENPAAITVCYTDLTAPSLPLNLKARANEGQAILTWERNPESDLKGYNIYQVMKDSKIKLNTEIVSGTTTYLHGDLNDTESVLQDGFYTYEITAVDTYSNESRPSNQAEALIYTPQLEQLYTPSGVSSVMVRGSQVKPSDFVDIYLSGTSQMVLTPIINLTADEQGRFGFNATLLAGENWFWAKAADATGNKSKISEPMVVFFNEPPMTPNGLQGQAEDRNVHLTWNANSEPDLAGYFIYRDKQKLNQTMDVTTGTASASYNSIIANRAFDRSSSTYWYCYTDDDSPQWWQLDLPAPELIQQIELDFMYAYYAPRDYDIQVWTGYTWLTLVQVKDNNQAYTIHEFKSPYRTQRLRILLKSASESNTSVRLHEVYVLKASPVAALAQPWFIDPELNKGQYHYQVSAVDTYGLESPLSAEVMVPVGDLTPPDVPLNLTAVTDQADVILTWSANSEPDLDGYQVYKKNDQGWDRINSALETATTFTDSSLANGTYTYRVTAVDKAGNESVPSNEASATVKVEVPNQPKILPITAIPEGGSLRICWEYKGTPMTGFNLYRALQPGGPYVKVNAELIQDNCYLDEGLINGQKYYYYVTAVDEFGQESPHSEEAYAAPQDIVPPPKPVIFFPTVSGQPIELEANKTDIMGWAEPGSLVKVFKNNVTAGTTQASAKIETQNLYGDCNNGMDEVVLSPDNKKLAYHCAYPENYSIRVKDLITGQVRTIIEQNYYSNLKWSPGSDQLLFAYRDDDTGNNHFLVYDFQTGQSTPLTGNMALDEYEASWSPDGTQIVFDAYNTETGDDEIRIKDLGTGFSQKIVSSTEGWLERPVFSANGQKLVYIYHVNEDVLCMVDLADLSIRVVDNTPVYSTADFYTFAWSPQGEKLAFASRRNGYEDIYVLDVAENKVVQLTDYSQTGITLYGLAWAPDGSSLVYYMVNGSQPTLMLLPINPQNKIQILAEPESWVQDFSWTKTGAVTYSIYPIDSLYLIYPAGYFRIPDAELAAGMNRFSATAADAAGNVSQPADEVVVTTPEKPLPDLETRAEDIIIYPAGPMKGQEVSIYAIIKNKGPVKAENVQANLYLTNTQGQVALLDSSVIPVLESGTEAAIHANWQSGDETGVHTIMVLVDPEAKIPEVSENNNFAFRDFYVATVEGVTLDTTLNGEQYEAYSDLVVRSVVSNSGPARSFVLESQIEDAFNTPVHVFEPLALDLAYGGVWQKEWTWNTESTYAGNYRVRTVLKENGNVVREIITPFRIKPEMALSADLSTNKMHYKSFEDVLMDIQLVNQGRNSDIPHLDVKNLILRDNVQVFSNTFGLDNLPADASVNLSAVWNTSRSAAGTYTAKVEFLLEGQTIANSVAEFFIDPEVKLSGTLKAVPITVYFNQPIRADFTVSNKGNASINELTVKILILDPDTQKVLDSTEKIVPMDLNGNGSGRCEFSTIGFSLKTYKLLLQAQQQGSVQTVATAAFSIKDGVPPVVTVLAPENQSSQRRPFDLRVQAMDDVSGVAQVQYRLDQEQQWRLLPPVDPVTSQYGTKWIPVEAEEGSHTIWFRAGDRVGNVSEPVSTHISIVPLVNITVNLNTEQYTMNADAAIKVNLANMDWAKNVTLKVNVTDQNGVVLRAFDPLNTVLAIDEAKDFDFSWNTGLNPAGPYRVLAKLTKAGVTLSEKEIGFTILPVLKFNSSLTTDKTHYGLKENAALNLGVTNTGNAVAPLLNLKLKIKPAVGQDIFAKELSLTNLAPNLTADLMETWNTAQNPAGNYQARLEVYLNNELTCFSENGFEIDPFPVITGILEVAPLNVLQGENYQANYTVSNAGNTSLQNLPVKVLVRDADQTSMAEQQALVTLGINESKTGSFIFSSQGYNLGSYQAILQAIWGGTSHDLDQKPFRVIDVTPPVVTILAPPNGSTQTGTFSMAVTAVDDASGVDWVEYQIDGGTWQRLALTNPAAHEYSQVWVPVPADQGSHTIAFRAADKAGNISKPVSTAIIIDLGGEPFEKLTGTLQATPNPVYLGLDESFQYSIRNEAGQALNGLSVKILVIDPATQETKITLSENIDLTANSVYTGTLKTSTTGLGLKTYQVLLKIEMSGKQPRKLAETAFELIASLEVTKIIKDQARLLVWVNDHCPPSCRSDAYVKTIGATVHSITDERSNCQASIEATTYPGIMGVQEPKKFQTNCEHACEDCINVNLLKTVLDQSAARYKIVFDHCAFSEELRNPIYTDILILGDQEPITDHVAAELREKVYGGVGLISSLWLKHGCSAGYDELFGVTYKGQLPYAYPLIETVTSPITDPGSLYVKGKPNDILAAEPTVIAGWIKGQSVKYGLSGKNQINCPQTPHKYPAIVLHNYGAGKAIYFAFDLGLTLNAQNQELLAKLLGNSIQYAHRAIDPSVIRPYELVPVEFKLKSLGGVFDLRISETFPEELEIYEPLSKQWITESPWTYATKLNQDEIKHILYYYLAPDLSGSYNTNTEVDFLINGEYIFFKNLPLAFSVGQDIPAKLEEAIAYLQGLSLPPNDKAKAQNAVQALQAVKNRIIKTRQDAALNIRNLLKAIEFLRGIQKADMGATRIKLDQVLMSQEALYYLFVPPAAYLEGKMAANPNPVKINQEVIFHLTAINKGDESFKDLKVRAVIIDPDTRNEVKVLEQSMALEGNSTLTLDLKTRLTGFKAKTYHVLLKAYSALLTEPKVLAELDLQVVAH
jgi:subtilase family serine protease/Tol biopolymer transport system component/flagellar hook assembly protein FlgD/fibronectin type 3 domain-containing protein